MSTPTRRASRRAWVTAGIPCVALLSLALAPAALHAQGGAPSDHLLIVSGLSGEERFARDFVTWGAAIRTAMVQRHGVPASNVVWLAEDASAHEAIGDRSTRANIERELRLLAERAGAADRVLILLFGHGSYQAGESRINLPGPDINAKELAVMLSPLTTQRVVIVNASSASGGFIQDLAAANRIVVTATRSGMEANETVFGRHFTAALAGDAADTDKSGRVSLLEAFEYTRLEVEREYERGNKLQTEHAVIDAVGDGKGLTELAAATPHAQAAASFHFGGSAAASVGASPELRALYDEKARIEAALDALRARRDALPAVQYEAELEKLLVELSLNAQAIRSLEGGRS